jgi:hypothetical protein
MAGRVLGEMVGVAEELEELHVGKMAATAGIQHGAQASHDAGQGASPETFGKASHVVTLYQRAL